MLNSFDKEYRKTDLARRKQESHFWMEQSRKSPDAAWALECRLKAKWLCNQQYDKNTIIYRAINKVKRIVGPMNYFSRARSFLVKTIASFQNPIFSPYSIDELYDSIFWWNKIMCQRRM